MIPVNLQKGLIQRLEEIFSQFKLKNPNNEDVNINIFEQHLPQSESDDDDVSLYPYIIVKLADGEQENETSAHKIKVLFVIGVFDDSYDNNGYQDVVNIVQKLIAGLKSKPIIEKKFVLDYPMRWLVHEEDVYPFFFGGVETYWETNAFQRVDEGGFLHG